METVSVSAPAMATATIASGVHDDLSFLQVFTEAETSGRSPFNRAVMSNVNFWLKDAGVMEVTSCEFEA